MVKNTIIRAVRGLYQNYLVDHVDRSMRSVASMSSVRVSAACDILSH